MSRQMAAVFECLDAIGVAIVNLSGPSDARPATPAQGWLVAQREVFATRRKERAVPFNTIRQVSAVLDELEADQ